LLQSEDFSHLAQNCTFTSKSLHRVDQKT
jgi:hypothetical protein